MIKCVLVALGGLMGLLFSTVAGAATVSELAWMQGHWQSSDGASWSEEHWLAPREGLMLAVNRGGDGQGRVDFEFLRIQADAAGTPIYWAAPGGSAPVPFSLSEISEQRAVFVNPEHDYPQQISYVRDGNTLTATIAASDGTGAMSFSWKLAK